MFKSALPTINSYGPHRADGQSAHSKSTVHKLHLILLCYRSWSICSLGPCKVRTRENEWNSSVQFIRIKCKSTLLDFITLHPITNTSQKAHNKAHLFIGIVCLSAFISAMVAFISDEQYVSCTLLQRRIECRTVIVLLLVLKHFR